MRNQNNKIALKPRSAIILPDHLRIRFHEASGTALPYTGKINGTAFSGSLTFSAAPTWGNGGAKAPTTNTTVHALATQASHGNLFSVLTPPASGGLIFLWSYYMTAFTNNSSIGSNVLTWGNQFSGGDGYRVGTVQGTNHNITLGYRGAGEGSTSQASKSDNTLSTQKTVQMYLKTTDGALAAYTAVDGAWASAGSATSTGSFSHGAPANYTAAAIFTSVNTGPVVGNEYMNRGATDDKIISDLLVIRDTDGSLFAKMATIAAEHAKYRQELLRALEV